MGDDQEKHINKDNIVFAVFIEDGKLITYGKYDNSRFLPQSLGIAMIEIPNMFRYFKIQEENKKISINSDLVIPRSN